MFPLFCHYFTIFLAVLQKLNILILVGVLWPTLFLKLQCKYSLNKDLTTPKSLSLFLLSLCCDARVVVVVVVVDDKPK